MATAPPRRRTLRQPTALLISSNHAVLAAVHASLTAAQFAVVATASPLAGYEYAVHTVGLPVPSRTTVIFIDTGDVYSIVVAAGLSQRIQQRVIPRVWLIALLDSHEPEREREARLAGCQQVLHLPIAESAMDMLQRQLKQPAPLPYYDPALATTHVISTLQTIADRMLHAALEVQPDLWTARDVAHLLYQLTTYPMYPHREIAQEEQRMNLLDMNLRTEQIIRTLGGIQAARHFLAECVPVLEMHYPLHGKVLEKFLAGWQRKPLSNTSLSEDYMKIPGFMPVSRSYRSG